MSYRLPAASLTHAIKHLNRYGDTDVFPHLPELAFLREQEALVVKELENLDLDTFDPVGAIEALGPKSRYGFRIVHQLPLVDTVLLLAAVIEIGPLIEAHRQPLNELRARSYRFELDGKGAVFRLDRTFKDWLNAQLVFVQGNLKIKRIISTDISDFYARVNFHRLENLLDEVAPKHGAARFIIKHIKVIRAKQSFGLPVGGSAARLLAELALTDTDLALKQDDRSTTRFVDDFRIFLRVDEDPYGALAFLAEQLGISEGLSLNVTKTRVETRTEFLARLKYLVADVSEEAEGAALEALTSNLYFDEEPDEEELAKLKSMNLLGFLQEEAGKEALDLGRIKVIFRALKLAKPPAAVSYILANFNELIVFAKEMTLLMEALEGDDPGCFDDLSEDVVNSILASPASSIQLVKTWLLELFVRGVVPVDAAGLKKLDGLSSPLDRRQLHLIRGRIGDKVFFRKMKTGFGQISVMEQPCFVWGASCLPKDGYRDVWVKGFVDAVVIFCDGAEIARHERSYDYGDFVFEPRHYLALLEQKPGALDQAAPLQGWVLPEALGCLRRLLEARMGKRGKREFIQVLRLTEAFAESVVVAAAQDAIRLGAISFDAVKQLAVARVENRPAHLDLSKYPYLPAAHVATTEPADYLALLSKEAA